mmetsp:Transcript_53839/g.136694  ORF Transcript_53839/g.136694 Transcript_53839/m.136694 type:complete len:397 (+) Transcript_53839:173-1363(+)
MTEDDEPLLATSVQCHEHVRARLLLHAAQFAATVAGHPALAILRDMHLCGVIALRNVWNGDAAAALRQQPIDKLLATLALLQRSCDEGHVPDILQNGARCAFKLLPRCALLAQGVAQLIILEDHAVSVEALLGARLLPDTTSEIPWAFVLHAAHDFQFGSPPPTGGAKDDELLTTAPTAPALVLCLVHEEHKHAPLLLQRSERCATSTGDVADAVARYLQNRAIVTVLPAFHVHRPLQLIKEPLHILSRPLALRTRTGEDGDMSYILHYSARRSLHLFASAALLPESVGELVILESHRVCAPSAGRIAAPVAIQDLALELREIARHLRLYCTQHFELSAAASPDPTEDRKLLIILAPPVPAAHLTEEHQSAPLLLDGAEKVTSPASNEAHCLLRDV